MQYIAHVACMNLHLAGVLFVTRPGSMRQMLSIQIIGLETVTAAYGDLTNPCIQ